MPTQLYALLTSADEPLLSVANTVVSDGDALVSDEGPGIAPVGVPFAFDRFCRSLAARALPCSGFGLAIVRQDAELHGGSARWLTRGRVPFCGGCRWKAGQVSSRVGPAAPRGLLGEGGAGSPGVQPDRRGQALGDRPDICGLEVAQDDDLGVSSGENRVGRSEAVDRSIVVVFGSVLVDEPAVPVPALGRIPGNYFDAGTEHLLQSCRPHDPLAAAH